MVKGSSKKQAKANKLISLAKAREARIQKEIPLKLSTDKEAPGCPRGAYMFIKGVLDILVVRALALQTDTDIPDPSTAAIACHHVTAIGSSQLHKLSEPCFGVNVLHTRAYYIGAKSEGARWEDVWSYNKQFYHGGVCYKIQKSFKEPNRFSNDLPWVTATPDFIAQLKTRRGAPFWAVIEIKSYVSEKPSISDYKKQVQVAMDCFNVDVGFIVIYNGNESIDQYPTILKLKRDYYLSKNKTSLNMKYYGFLERCSLSLFRNSISLASIEEMFQKLVEIEIPLFRLEWESLKARRRCFACYVNVFDRNLGKRKREKKVFLRHVGHINLLGVEQIVYVPVDENGYEITP